MTNFRHVKATEDGTQIETSLRTLEDVIEDAINALPSSTPVRVTFQAKDFETLMLACRAAHRRDGRIFVDLLEHAEEGHRKLSGDASEARDL